MSMSKKDFIALADVVYGMQPTFVRGNSIFEFTLMRDKLADFCQSQNPNFNRDRWLDYIAGKCGPSGGAR